MVPAAAVAGIAAFSDGAGERLISHDGTEIREGAVSRIQLLDFLRDRDVWAKTTRDDRSLALLARGAETS